MSANEFDELIRHKFDETDIAFNPGNWEKMSQQLNKVQQPNKNSMIVAWPALAGIAATIALLIALPMLWLQSDNDSKNNIVRIEQAVEVPPAAPAPPATVLQNNVTYNEPQSVIPANNHLKKVAKSTTARMAGIAADVPESKAKTTIITDNTTDSDIAMQSRKPFSYPAKKENLAIPNADANIQGNRTSINLIGGFNYNAASAGYMIGASANRNLNDKLYVEGNIAYVNTNVGGKGSFDKMAYSDNFDPSPVTNNQAKEPENHPLQYNLSYLQFSPVMGYHISERFTISAGPDLQQLLNTDNYFISDLPKLDMGLIGKAEYGITEKLKAGLQYRAGINNVIQSKEYTERNYMQVQVRYSIFNK